MARTAVGLYHNDAEAQQVVEHLLASGFKRRQVQLQNKASDGLDRSLESEGVPTDAARQYLEGVRQGGSLVTVRANDNAIDKAVGIMNEGDIISPDEGDTLSPEARPAAGDRVGNAKDRAGERALDQEGEETLNVIEEEMRVGKREVKRGGVRIHTYVTEKPVEEEVSLRDETLHVDRQPVDRPATETDLDTFQEGTLEMTETDEEAVAEKRARVVEEVNVGKDVTQRQETVHGAVRRTNVDVEESGPNDYPNDHTDASVEPAFRKHYEAAPSRNDYSYEQAAPAYHYGYNLAHDKRYHGRKWEDIEPEARQNWEARNPGTWDSFQEAVHHGWDEAHRG